MTELTELNTAPTSHKVTTKVLVSTEVSSKDPTFKLIEMIVVG